MIEFACQSCGKTYEVDDKHAGKTTKCAKCKSQLVVPNKDIKSTDRETTVFVSQSRDALPSPSSLNVTVETKQPTASQGFFRAFGITSGFMAAIAAVLLGIPILICGGCLASMIGINAAADRPSEAPANPKPASPSQTAKSPPAEKKAAEPPLDNPTSEKVVETIILQTLPSVDLSNRPYAYPVSDLTANIKDKYISDVRLIDLKQRPVRADILLENQSGKDWNPSFEIEFVNAYGIVLGYDSVSWFTSLKPKERRTETIEFYPLDFNQVFRYSKIHRPPEYDLPKYVVIKYR